MLIQFRVENHRSLRDEQILSLVASSHKAGTHVLRTEGLGEAVVPVIAIYGANASGKSNVLAALRFMTAAVRNSQTRWNVEGTPQQPFRLSGKAREPSLYEVEIIVDGIRFRYGFQLSALCIEEEWLFAWPHERKAMWFEREGDKFEFGKTLRGENETIRSLTRPNSLFLSAAAQNNHAALLPIYRHITDWRFPYTLPGGFGSSVVSMVSQRLDAQGGAAGRDAIVQLLQGADTGILDVRVERLEERSKWGTRPRSELQFRHRTVDGAETWLRIGEESSGTVALIQLAPHIIDTLRGGGLLCIDEIESSLHPTLALNIVRLFNDPVHNTRNAQLIFATHDTNLLGSVIGEPVLHRDRVWFTEKDEGGWTHLYPLTDFHPRKEENLERGYLQGRYGAIPFLGELVSPLADEARSGEPVKATRGLHKADLKRSADDEDA